MYSLLKCYDGSVCWLQSCAAASRRRHTNIGALQAPGRAQTLKPSVLGPRHETSPGAPDSAPLQPRSSRADQHTRPTGTSQPPRPRTRSKGSQRPQQPQQHADEPGRRPPKHAPSSELAASKRAPISRQPPAPPPTPASSAPLPSAPASSPSTSSSTSASASSPAAPAPASTSTSATSGLSPEVLQRYRLSPAQHRQLETYLDYMLEVNQSMNLTAVRDKGDAWERHVVDSLALLPVIHSHTHAPGPAPETRSGTGGEVAEQPAASASAGAAAGPHRSGPLRVVDVGTGAGLPGMVLAVARPEWKVTLLDSLRKRCDFLREAAARAGLSNVEVVWCRAEEGGHKPELRQAYDLAVARAVAETRVLAELCLPFVRVGGHWVAAKGPDPEVEVAAASAAIRQLGGRQVALERVESRSAEGQRTALVVAKVAPTPARLPRAPGTPNKKPL